MKTAIDFKYRCRECKYKTKERKHHFKYSDITESYSSCLHPDAPKPNSFKRATPFFCPLMLKEGYFFDGCWQKK